MAKKLGNAGHGLESYDPETGRYIAEDKDESGVKKYHAGAHFGVSEIVNMITDGYYGEDFKKDFLEGDENEKSAVIGYLQSKLDAYYTKKKIENEKKFESITQQEFDEYGEQCAAANSPQDLNYFYHGYMGAGQKSFQFNKALRKNDLSYLATVNMTKQEFDARVAAFDKLANSFECPKNMQTFRYDGPSVLVSWFGGSGIFNGVPIVDNGYGYATLDMNKTNIEDLSKRMKRLIGSEIPRDGAYSSFSCVEKASHMIKNTDRFVKIKYNIPKGQKCFISQYRYESEGFFPRDIGFVLQDVKVEKEGDLERLVLYYGIKE